MYKISIINDKNPSIIDDVVGIEFNQLHNITSTKNYSPFTFNDGKRNQVNSKTHNLICFDIDEGLELKKAIDLCSNFKSLIVTTKSHQVDKKGLICDRYRILIPIDKEVPKEQFKSFYIDLSKYLTLDNVIDKACNDVARYFYPNSNQEVFYSTSSNIISYDEVMPKLNDFIKTNDYHKTALLNNELPNNFIFKDGSSFESYEYLGTNETVKIRCFNAHHEDKNPSAFISRNPNSGKLFVSCSSCNETKFIKYFNEDGIINNTHNPLISNDIITKTSPLQALKNKAYSLTDIKNLKDIKMLLNGLIPHNHITMIYAPSNQGKTTATMGIINRILRDKPEMECLYFDFDNGANTMKPHLIKILDEVKSFNYISYEKMERAELFAYIDKLTELKEDLNKFIFCFDSLQHFVNTDLSSAKAEPELKELFERFKKLRKLGATIFIISHTTKEKNSNGKEEIFRGLNIIKDNLDNMFLLNRENNDSYLFARHKSRHESIKDYIKLPYNHDKVLIENAESLDKQDYAMLLSEQYDSYFIKTVQDILFTDGEMNQKDLSEKIHKDDNNSLSMNEIKDKLRRYKNKHWLILRGAKSTNIYKSINPITKNDIEIISNAIINQNDNIEIIDKSLISE